MSQPTPKANPPQVIQTSDPLSRADYWLQVTWANSSGFEGAPSDPISVSLGPGDSVRIAAPPAGIRGWNLYAGADRDDVQTQNATLLDTAAVWVMGASLIAGMEPGSGQLADYFIAERQFLLRG